MGISAGLFFFPPSFLLLFLPSFLSIKYGGEVICRYLHQEEEHGNHASGGVELSASSKPGETTHVEGFGSVFQRLVALALGCDV